MSSRRRSVQSMRTKSLFTKLAMSVHCSATFCATGAWGGKPIGRVRVNVASSKMLHHLKLKISTAGLINQYRVNHFLFHVKKVKIIFIFSHGMCSNVMRLIMMRPRRISVLSVILSVIIRLMSLAEVIFSCHLQTLLISLNTVFSHFYVRKLIDFLMKL